MEDQDRQSFRSWNSEDFLSSFGRMSHLVGQAREAGTEGVETLLAPWGLTPSDLDKAITAYGERHPDRQACGPAAADFFLTAFGMLGERPHIATEVSQEVIAANEAFAGTR